MNQTNPNNTRCKIIKVASKLFCKRNYDSVSMSDIASQVGIAKPSLYHFFKDKDEIYAMTIIEIVDELTQKVEESLENPTQTLNQFIDQLMEISIKKGTMLECSTELHHNHSHPLHKEITQKHTHLIAQISKFLQQKSVKEPEKASFTLLMLIHTYAKLTAKLADIPIQRKEYADYLTNLFKS